METGMNLAGLVALVPIVLGMFKWFQGHGSEVFIRFDLTYQESIFWVGLGYFLLKIIHWSKPPGAP